jgi:hypothetical protein
MRMMVRAASALLTAAAVTAPIQAATIVILPGPGSLSQPRIFSDGTSDASIYVCSTPNDLRSGRCSIQRKGSGRR